jgi:hypothetical protein
MKMKEWSEYRALKDAGWQVTKTNQVRFNGGSETVEHSVAKMLAAHAGKEAGYRVSSEVEHDTRGEIDVLLFGCDSRISLAVECENDVQDDVVEDKVDRYVRGTPIDDIAVIAVDELPENIPEAYEEIKTVLGL